MDGEKAFKWIQAELGGAEAHRQRYGRPLVTLSYAQSLDGSLTARRGEPFALSGPGTLALTHRLRAAHQAILVGIGTVLSDNPRLSARLADGPDPQPVVLDSRLSFPLSARLLSGAGRKPWIAAASGRERAGSLEGAGATLLFFEPDGEGWVPLPALLGRLAELGIGSLMVEGGARVISAFLTQHLVDLALITVAPLWLGGLRSVECSLGETGLALGEPGYEQIGVDMVVWGRAAR